MNSHQRKSYHHWLWPALTAFGDVVEEELLGGGLRVGGCPVVFAHWVGLVDAGDKGEGRIAGFEWRVKRSSCGRDDILIKSQPMYIGNTCNYGFPLSMSRAPS